MEFPRRNRKRNPPQYIRPHSKPDNRDKKPTSSRVVDDFEWGLHLSPSPSPEVTVIEDDEPDHSDHVAGGMRRLSSNGTMYDQHKTPGEYKALSGFKIPKKQNNVDLTSRPNLSNETTNVGSQPMPPSSNIVNLMNRAKSIKPRTTTNSNGGYTNPDFRTRPTTAYTDKIPNSMESSLPAPKKKRAFSLRANRLRSESPAETTNFGSQENVFWNDTHLGLEDPNSSFGSPNTRSNSRDSRKPSASISPNKDDEIASNASSEGLNLFEFMKHSIDKDSPTKPATCTTIIDIDDDNSDSDSDPEATTSTYFKSPLPNLYLPPKASPKKTNKTNKTNHNAYMYTDLLSNTESILKTCSEKSTGDDSTTSSTHRNKFAKSHIAPKENCSIQVTPKFLSKEQATHTPSRTPSRTGTAADILSIVDSPVLSKEAFTFEVDKNVAKTATSSAAETKKPSTTSRTAYLPSELARRPLKRPAQSVPGSFYGSKESPSDHLFSHFTSTVARSTRPWGTSSSRMSSVRGKSASQVMANYGVKNRVKNPLKLKRSRPLLFTTADVDDEESLPLAVQCVQIGRLEPDKVLHVELRNDVLCMKLDYEGRTETVKIDLNDCFAWQFHLGEEPYVICITVKVNPAKKIAETLSKKYHLDSDFFNPKSQTVSAQYVLLTLEERPLSHLVDSILECLAKTSMCVDHSLSAESVREMLEKPSKPSRSHGRPLSNDDLKTCVPSLNVRRSQRTRKAPVRMDPSSPISLLEPVIVQNKPNVKLLTYNVPAGSKVNIELSTHDLDTLLPGEYINDKVVDFYLRYMWYEKLAERLRSKVHIFSSFFHTRLKDASRDNQEHKGLQTPERMHTRVKTWTRRVDLFDKEYIVLPVCDRAHWFVAFVYKAGEFDPLREQAARDAKAAKKNKRKPLKRKPLHVDVISPVVINDTLVEGETEEPIQEDWLVPGAQLTRAAKGQSPQALFGDFIQMSLPPSDDEVDIVAEVPMETDDTVRIDAAATMATIETATDPLMTDKEDAHSTTLTTSDEHDRIREGETTPPGGDVMDVGQPEALVVSVEDSLEEGTTGEEVVQTVAEVVSPEHELVSPEHELVGDSSTEELDTLEEETRPCVLVLDSLGVRRTGIVKTIRNYLTVEWKERKVRDGVEELKYDLLPAKYPEIPLQNNSSDCGLFMLQYVESLLLRMEEGLTYPETAEGWGSYEKTGSKRKEIDTLITGLGKIQSSSDQTTTDTQEP